MLDYSQIEALLAVEEEGTFEGAARSLGITAFAITQRIKLLEKTLGVPLIERKPTRTSEAGMLLCDHAREVLSLEASVLEQQHIERQETKCSKQTLKIALNDESLASWFGQVLKDEAGRENGFCFDITLTDCARSAELMQSGSVAAAVSNQKQPVHGFKSYTLGKVHYLPIASGEFVNRYFNQGVSETNLIKAPCLRFCKDDRLAFEWTKQVFGRTLQLTLFKHPSTTSQVNNCLNHLAWGMAPRNLVDVHLRSGDLVELIPEAALSRTLYWHVSGGLVDDLARVTKAVKASALSAL